MKTRIMSRGIPLTYEGWMSLEEIIIYLLNHDVWWPFELLEDLRIETTKQETIVQMAYENAYAIDRAIGGMLDPRKMASKER